MQLQLSWILLAAISAAFVPHSVRTPLYSDLTVESPNREWSLGLDRVGSLQKVSLSIGRVGVEPMRIRLDDLLHQPVITDFGNAAGFGYGEDGEWFSIWGFEGSEEILVFHERRWPSARCWLEGGRTIPGVPAGSWSSAVPGLDCVLLDVRRDEADAEFHQLYLFDFSTDRLTLLLSRPTYLTMLPFRAEGFLPGTAILVLSEQPEIDETSHEWRVRFCELDVALGTLRDLHVETAPGGYPRVTIEQGAPRCVISQRPDGPTVSEFEARLGEGGRWEVVRRPAPARPAAPPPPKGTGSPVPPK